MGQSFPNDPILSICVITYGHEKYISRALDSILMQKTQYSYEVLVGEDASPDHTRDILVEYEHKYPGVFQMFYREKNMMQIGQSNLDDLMRKTKGKYVIKLEGDDFWVDELKIEKQISFLENNPQYFAVAHNCVVVGTDSEPNGENYPECKHTKYSLSDFLHDVMPGQLTTFMCKNYYLNEYFDLSIFEEGLIPGDRILYFAAASVGEIYVIQEVMSAYRHVTNAGFSFSANHKYDFKEREHWCKSLLDFSKTLGNEKSVDVAEVIYVREIIGAIRLKKIAFGDFFRYLNAVDNKLSVLIDCLFFYVSRGKKHRWK